MTCPFCPIGIRYRSDFLRPVKLSVRSFRSKSCKALQHSVIDCPEAEDVYVLLRQQHNRSVNRDETLHLELTIMTFETMESICANCHLWRIFGQGMELFL